MKAKVKKGLQYLLIGGYSNLWNDITNFMVINFVEKNTYKSFKQIKNHLIIETTKGEIDIVFTGEVPKLVFENFCKDQLILNIQ